MVVAVKLETKQTVNVIVLAAEWQLVVHFGEEEKRRWVWGAT
jgi:hypothetical protein